MCVAYQKHYDEIETTEFVPEVKTNKRGKQTTTTSKRNQSLIISMGAHNGFKADFPIFKKALLNDLRFTLTKQCASGMA